MAENQTETETAVQEPEYTIRVEDAGPASKKVWVEIPKERVAAKITEQLKQLRHDAHIPGFRKGHAPAKLIERKFADDVKEQVRRTLISESYEKAIEDNKFQVLGEPEFENADAIKLVEGEGLTYSFSIDIQPTITLPELKGLKIKKPKITVTDEHLNQAMLNLREQQGALVPVEDRGVANKDFLVADVNIKVDGKSTSQQADASLVSRPGRIAGIFIADLDKQLEGAKPTETRTINTKIPKDYPTEEIREKDVAIEITLKDIKRLEPAELNQEFLDSLGFTNEQELRDALKEQMNERITTDIQQVMRRQVTDHLLANVSVELPPKLSSKQTERVVNRRAVALMSRGVPQERLEANIEALKSGADEEAARELKTFFILSKVAEEQKVEVSEGELNTRVALLAMQQGVRPEKLKQQLAKDNNMLSNLYLQLREEKAIDKILEGAEVEEVEATAEEQKASVEGAGESST